MLPRLFSNTCEHCTPNGSIEQNGCGKLNDISTRAIKSIADLGATHIWYTGIIEHATKTDYSAYGIKRDNPFIVKGKAGSPYAIKDYYDIDPDLAVDVPNRMSEFEALVERTHVCGLKVIIDFVPNHVARQYHSDAAPCGIEDFGASDNTGMFFNPNNNFYYIGEHFSPTFDIGTGDDAYREFPAKASGNDCFNAHPGICDWYETVKLNYGIDPSNGSFHFEPMPDTWRKMLDILLFWAAKGIDAFRCDMAHMVPVEFWAWAIRAVKSRHPHIKFIAELYDVGIYRDYILRGGFDYLYDKVNLYDTLRAICCNNAPACQITHCWQTVDGIGNHMLNFLENHDEQRFASAHYAGDPWRAIPAFVVCATLSTGPVMLYAGQELGEKAEDAEGFSGNDGRTTIFDYWSIPTVRRWYNNGKCGSARLSENEIALRNAYKKILHIAKSEQAIAEGNFFDLMYVNFQNPALNPHDTFAYLREKNGILLVIAANFSNSPRSCHIVIPTHAFDTLTLPKGVYPATELLSGTCGEKALSPDSPFITDIPANGAVIWKIDTTRRHMQGNKSKKTVTRRKKS